MRLNVETGSAEEDDNEGDADQVEVVIDEDSFENPNYTAAGDHSSEDEERDAEEELELILDEDIGEDCNYTAVVGGFAHSVFKVWDQNRFWGRDPNESQFGGL